MLQNNYFLLQPKEKETEMAYVKKADRVAKEVANEPVNTQELLDEIAQLKREKAELAATQVDAEPADAMTYLMAQNAEMMKALGAVVARGNQVVNPGPLKSRKDQLNQPYTLTDERKAQVEALFAQYEGRGIQYAFDAKSPSVTFRREVTIRVFDKELETWVKDKAWKSESFHCSTDDRTIHKLIKFMLLV